MTFGGRYEIVRPIARGGMAEVYLATDTRLHRPVAIKRMLEEFAANSDFHTRFEREARAAAGLNQANMVQVYDYGIEDAKPYIVMEYVRGKTLRDLLREQGVPPPERGAEVVADVAGALQTAHEHGIVHRDIKPANIMVDADGVVKVTDFGIAQDSHQDSELTQAGSVVGTAAYFSPEQAQGKPADARSDVYSMGCVLYELATGRPPFDGESAWAIAYKHVNEQVPSPASVVPTVPRGLNAIVMKALEKDPAQRYQSAWEMREDLIRFLRGEDPLALIAPAAVGAAAAATAVAPAVGAPATSTMSAVPGPEGEKVPETRRRWPWVVAIVVILAALGVGLYFLVSALTSSAAQVEVPDVQGKSVADAEQALQTAGFRTTTEQEASKTVDKGNVIRTDPAAGEKAGKGSTVTIYESAGGEPVDVPDVVGQTEQAARSTLTEAGFKVQVTRVSNDADEGAVVAQDPAAGTSLTPGETILLSVSEGPVKVTVPDVRGLTEDEAMSALARAGFKVNPVQQESSQTAGTVISQVPSQGAQAPEGSTVTIQVSAGESATVPNVIGESKDAATSKLQAAGFQVSAQETPSCSDENVCAQSPTGGTKHQKGSTVTINYGLPPPPTTVSSPTTTPTTPTTTTAP